jgi:hypothetical protein
MSPLTRNPSCLISWSHMPPEGSVSVLVGRLGAMKPAGRVRCNIAPIANGCSCASQQFFDCAFRAIRYRRAVSRQRPFSPHLRFVG